MHHQLFIMIQLLLTVTIVAVFARRFRVPYSTALVLTGLALAYLQLFPPVELNTEIVINVFLPILLFEAAINTDATNLRENFKPVFLLSTLGMAVMTGITGAALHFLLGLPWAIALLAGSMLSITDTVAVLAIFKNLKAPARLTTIAEGESLFNDGTALVLFRLLLAVALTGTFNPIGSAIQVGVVSVGGLVVGGVIGLVASWVLQQTRDHLTEILISTVVALGGFYLAEQLHVSGVIAVVTAGLVVGNYGWKRALPPSSQIALGSFWEYAAFGVNSAVFLLVGLNIEFLQLTSALPAIGVAFVAVLLGRVCAIYPAFALLKPFDRSPVPVRWQHVMVWGNIKGSLTMALALSLPAELPHRSTLITVIFGVVLLSLLLQGLTLGPLVRGLKLTSVNALRQLFEREQLRVLASRAAQSELRTLHEAGILSKSAYERLRARYQVSIAQSERELRRLGTEFQEHWDEVLTEIRQRLVVVEKGAVLNAMREQLISEDVGRQFIQELDEQLVERPGEGEA